MCTHARMMQEREEGGGREDKCLWWRECEKMRRRERTNVCGRERQMCVVERVHARKMRGGGRRSEGEHKFFVVGRMHARRMRGSRRRKEKYLWWRGCIRGGGLIKWWRVVCGGEGRCTQEG